MPLPSSCQVLPVVLPVRNRGALRVFVGTPKVVRDEVSVNPHLLRNAVKSSCRAVRARPLPR